MFWIQVRVILRTSSGRREDHQLLLPSSLIPSLPTSVCPSPTPCIRCTDADSAADPLTWLLPNGLLFMQANWQTTLVNYTTSAETRLPNITKAQKTYPATGAIAMLPLTVENGFQPTLLFCGGMDPVRDE